MRNMKRYAPIFATMAIYFCSYVKSNIDIFGLMLSNHSFDFFYTPVRPPNAKPDTNTVFYYRRPPDAHPPLGYYKKCKAAVRVSIIFSQKPALRYLFLNLRLEV